MSSPLSAIDWDTIVIRKVGPVPLNKFLQNLRSSKVRQTGYFQFRNTIADGLREMAGDLPRYWRIWGAFARQFRISETLTWGEHTTVRRHLQLGNFDAPTAPFRGDENAGRHLGNNPALIGGELLWRRAKCFTSYGSSFPSPPVTSPTTDAIRVIELAKNQTAESAGYAKRDSELRKITQLPGNFTKLTPMGKTETLSRPGEAQRLVNEFLDNGDKLNILRSAQVSLRSVASGINYYLRFCTMADSAAFPPSTGTIRRRGATFNAGETFGLYINHAHKAGILLGHDDAWLTPEVLLAKGMRNAQDKSCASPNYITKSDVVRLILDR